MIDPCAPFVLVVPMRYIAWLRYISLTPSTKALSLRERLG